MKRLPLFLTALAASTLLSAAPASDDAALIRSAAGAAPPAIGRDATIVTMSGDGAMRVLRQGSNGFTCMPDNPATPGPDPMCMDANAAKWAEAWVGHKPPPADTVGLMYMLGGGTDASNTDPYAQKPTAGNHWVNTGPHLMIVGSDSLLKNDPASATPDTSRP